MKRTERFIALVVFLLVGGLIAHIISASWKVHQAHCPIHDVLTWDENLRHILILDQYQDLKQGHLVEAILPVLDLPTWPYLHSGLALLAFFITPGGPSIEADVLVSTAFYALLFVALFAVAIRWTSPLVGAAIWTFASVLVLEAKEFPAYSMSAMLESQGMFFQLVAVAVVYEIYRQVKDLTVNESSHRRRVLNIAVFLSVQGLLHTKYPYGILFVLTVFAFEATVRFRDYWKVVRFALTNYYRGWRLVPTLALLSLPVVYYVAQFILHVNMRGRPVRNGMYIVLLLLFIDVNFFYFKNRKALKQLLPESFRVFYEWGAFPAFAWMFIHPDRITAAFWYQGIVTHQTVSFFWSLFNDVHSTPWPVIAVLSVTMLGLAAELYFSRRPAARLSDRLNEPLTAITLLSYLQILVLELMTTNHQIRYIYHLIPTATLIGGVWAWRITERLQILFGKAPAPAGDSEKKRDPVFHLVPFIFAFAILATALAFSIREGGVLSSGFFASRSFCFTGTDTERIDGARWIARTIDPSRKYILFNAFHEVDAPLPGRGIASEIDLLLRMETIQKGDGTGRVRNDSVYRLKNWSGYSRVLLVTDTCEEAEAAMNGKPAPPSETGYVNLVPVRLYQRVRTLGLSIQAVKSQPYPDGHVCATEFEILRNSGEEGR